MSGQFTDADRRRILQESRELLEQRYAEPEISSDLSRSWSRPDDAAADDAVAATTNQPIETINARHIREINERDQQWARERRQREREAEARAREVVASSAVDWSAIDQRIEAVVVANIHAERDRMFEIVAMVVAGERKTAQAAIDRANQTLAGEVCAAQAAISEFKAALADAKAAATAAPAPSGRVVELGNGDTVTIDAATGAAIIAAAKNSLN